ncbi:MAG: hypothetical protein IIA63_02705 [Nitrospinae bacterium]|nr:hypothetical protein [Nitrospinota bacterium]
MSTDEGLYRIIALAGFGVVAFLAWLRGMVLAALLVLFLFVSVVPWASKQEVKEIREDLKGWYPRVIKMEADIEYLKKGQDEIKALIREK